MVRAGKLEDNTQPDTLVQEAALRVVDLQKQIMLQKAKLARKEHLQSQNDQLKEELEDLKRQY